jgi:hypothetical protein
MRLSLAVGMMAIGLSFSGTNAQQDDEGSDYTKMGDLDGPESEICKKPGGNCLPEVIIIGPPKPDTPELQKY